MIVDASRRLQSGYVPVGDGVRLAVDVWLPAGRTAAGGTVGTVMRVTRYHRAEAPPAPGPAADTNAAAGDLFNAAGFALVPEGTSQARLPDLSDLSECLENAPLAAQIAVNGPVSSPKNSEALAWLCNHLKNASDLVLATREVLARLLSLQRSQIFRDL